MRFPLAYPLKNKIIDDQSLKIITQIFPTKQNDVLMIRELAKKDFRIKRIIVFGSAVTMKCGMGSDLDIAVMADVSSEAFPYEIRRQFSALNIPIDVIDYNDIHTNLLKENIDKGVEIYGA